VLQASCRFPGKAGREEENCLPVSKCTGQRLTGSTNKIDSYVLKLNGKYVNSMCRAVTAYGCEWNTSRFALYINSTFLYVAVPGSSD